MRKKKIVIGIACDGFRITVDEDDKYWFSQEECVAPLMKELFESLGFPVTIEEDY